MGATTTSVEEATRPLFRDLTRELTWARDPLAFQLPPTKKRRELLPTDDEDTSERATVGGLAGCTRPSAPQRRCYRSVLLIHRLMPHAHAPERLAALPVASGKGFPDRATNKRFAIDTNRRQREPWLWRASSQVDDNLSSKCSCDHLVRQSVAPKRAIVMFGGHG